MLLLEARTSVCAQNESEKFSTINLQFPLSFFFPPRSLDIRDGTNLFMEKNNKVLSLPAVTNLCFLPTLGEPSIGKKKKSHVMKAFSFFKK